ncbi:MAG: hypothetical protein ACR65V_02305, partial [Methylocystis sp.]
MILLTKNNSFPGKAREGSTEGGGAMNIKFGMIALTVALASSSAVAADLSSLKGPVPPPPPPIWTGFYAGLNAGYGWGTSNAVTTGAAPLYDTLATDPFWGTPVGY